MSYNLSIDKIINFFLLEFRIVKEILDIMRNYSIVMEDQEKIFKVPNISTPSNIYVPKISNITMKYPLCIVNNGMKNWTTKGKNPLVIDIPEFEWIND